MHFERQPGRDATVIPFPHGSLIRRRPDAGVCAGLIAAMASLIARHVVSGLALYAASMHPEALWHISERLDID